MLFVGNLWFSKSRNCCLKCFWKIISCILKEYAGCYLCSPCATNVKIRKQKDSDWASTPSTPQPHMCSLNEACIQRWEQQGLPESQVLLSGWRSSSFQEPKKKKKESQNWQARLSVYIHFSLPCMCLQQKKFFVTCRIFIAQSTILQHSQREHGSISAAWNGTRAFVQCVWTPAKRHMGSWVRAEGGCLQHMNSASSYRWMQVQGYCCTGFGWVYVKKPLGMLGGS